MIALWTFGSGIGRVIGLVLILDGVGGMAIHNSVTATPRFPIEAAIGLGLWLAGHWIFAAKHGQYRSRVAQRVWRLPVLGWVAPIRRAS
ncbi:hypothetical protein [Gordonia humi]|uniref:Uncharacterized protein n=1 Tax=Gordonia humi TaxID=686429 RepID=A0A840FD73_9ACTN|nr:hypothetical protein [Gordonia humi]MBB4138070.1 hypothetical protein [Gordonia humi]